MPPLELPHWLMIAGTLLVIAGFIGVTVRGKNTEEVDPPSDEPTDTVREQMPPLPSLLTSRKDKGEPAIDAFDVAAPGSENRNQ
jgi:hypothetical protein